MTFEQWKDRPVYKAQCAGFKRAQELCGISLRPGQGLATKPDHILTTFGAFRPYRTREAQLLRDMVALSLRMDRLHKSLTCAEGK